MNERIKELAEQVWKEIYNETAIDGLDNSAPSIDEVVMFERKFAELIVEECIAQCWTVSELEHKGEVISECSKRIRKHFGVEE